MLTRNKIKLNKYNNTQISSEFRGIVLDVDENDFFESNKFNNEKLNKKEDIENDINKIKINYRRTTERRKTKKNSLKAARRSSILGNLKFFDEKDDEEEDELTFRQRITKFFEVHNKLFYIKLITTIVSILTGIYYVACTYKNSLFESLNYIDFFACTLFLIEHIINILLSHQIIFYILSIESLLSFLIEIPPLFSRLCNDFYLSGWYRFINVTRVLRFTKSYKIIEIIQGGENTVSNQIINIIAILFAIVYIWAGIIQMFDLGIIEENLKITFETLKRRNLILRKEFHHYIYFIIVSLTTVGYGEIIPESILGKFMIVILVMVILVVVPDQTSELINLSNAQSIYERKKYLSTPDISFVVLMGDIELDALKSFCQEYFNRNHGNPFKHIVILVNKFPDKSTELFLNLKDNPKFITYLQGDPMNDDDLLRSDILHAKSCIIFTNKNSIDPYSRDHQSLLLAICVKKFYYNVNLETYIDENKISNDALNRENSIRKVNNILKKNFRIFLQLNRPESCNHYYSTLQSSYRKNMLNDRLIVIESLKMNLLSKSCMTPGIISLISNLCISRSIANNFFKNEVEWIREYSQGQKNEIVKIYIEGDLLNYSFQNLANEIYNKFHSILIALEIHYKGGSFIRLNPQSNNTLGEIIDSAFGLTNKDKSNENNGIDDASLSFLGEGNQNNYESESDLNQMNEIISEIKKKKIKVSLYLICDEKESIEEVQKLDLMKENHKSSRKKESPINNNILDTSYLTTFNKSKKIKKSYEKSKKSEIMDKTVTYYTSDTEFEEENNDEAKYLVDLGNDGGLILNQEELNANYYTLNSTEKNYLYTNDIMREGIKDRNDIRHHIIICGMHHEILHFILPLRSKHIPEKLLKWIIILAPNLPTEIHDALSKFQKIIFIQGDPLYPDNLFRANITCADIAVIMGSTYSCINLNSNDINDIIGKEVEEILENDKNSDSDKKNKKVDEEMLDAKTLFIYKSIKKINSSIPIITELLKTNNMEFLLSSRELKKLYKHSLIPTEYKHQSISSPEIINNQSDKESENLKYEYTTVYAAGEICLPSLIDKITGQMFHKEFLYTIINLLLTGEKYPQKSSDKKLSHLFNNLSISNLFLIPCESRNESFSEMFKRLLTKNKMISIALYRKNVNENFYYVYANPKKTTLIRDTDLVFVLSSTENIIGLIEKNIYNLGQSLKENEINGLSAGEIDDKKIINENGSQPLMKSSQDSIQQQIENTSKTKPKNNLKINILTKSDKNEKRKKAKENNHFERKNKVKRTTIRMSEREINFNKGKYAEIDNLQFRLDKAMLKLKSIEEKYNNIENDVENFIKEGIIDEFSVYVNRKYNFHS